MKLKVGRGTATGEAQHTFVEVQQRGVSSEPYADLSKRGDFFAAKRDSQEIEQQEMRDDLNRGVRSWRTFKTVLVGSLCSKKEKGQNAKCREASVW